MAFSINESILIIFVVNMLRVLQKCTPSGLYLTMLVSSIITFVPISSCLKFSGWKIEYATPKYRLTCIGIRVILSWYFCKTLDTGKSGKKKSWSYSLVSKTSACKGFLLTVQKEKGCYNGCCSTITLLSLSGIETNYNYLSFRRKL